MMSTLVRAAGQVPVARPRWTRSTRKRVVATRASGAEDLPGILLSSAAKKLEQDIGGFAKLFDEDTPTHERPPTMPVAGNTLDIAQGGHKQMLEWAETYGVKDGVHEVKMLSQTILHLTDPKLARELMFDRADTFPDRGVNAMAKFFREDKAAFVNTAGTQWMAYRKMGTASVNGGALDRLAGKVAERSEALTERWSRDAGDRNAIEVEISEASQAVTLEVIHEALFSETLDVIDGEKDAVALARSFREYNVASGALLNEFLSLYTMFETPERARRDVHRRRLRAHFDERADARRAAMARDGVDAAPRDLLTALLTARDPATGENLTRDDVNLTLTEMMVAGHDTTAATVACMMALLASHPEVKATVTAEVDEFRRNNGGALPSSVADANSLIKLDDAMKETMRLYPAVLIVVRKADEGVSGVLRKGPGGEVVVPDGAGMWISPYVMGRLARHWGGDEEDVKRYRPGRFEEARERGDSLDAYMPFGGGPRVCLGSRFAMLEGKILAAHILAEFDVELAAETRDAIAGNGGELPIAYAAGLMAFPEPLRMRARRRGTASASGPR